MNILLTGATGFIGSHLTPLLINTEHNVAILKKSSTIVSVKNIKIYNSDTYNDINYAISNFKPNLIIHLATLYLNKHEPENINNLINSNITFGTYLLEAMVKNKIKFFLNIGTRWQHINNEFYHPANFYAATKEAFKNILLYYGTLGIKYKIIELSDTYGSNDNRQKIVDLLITSCLKNEQIDLTPGEQILDLLYVKDVCNYIISNISNELFFDNDTVSLSGTIITIKDLGIMLEKKFNKNNLFLWGNKPYRDNEVMSPPVFYRTIKLNPQSLENYIDNIILQTK